jgi:hypothetical protein
LSLEAAWSTKVTLTRNGNVPPTTPHSNLNLKREWKARMHYSSVYIVHRLKRVDV